MGVKYIRPKIRMVDNERCYTMQLGKVYRCTAFIPEFSAEESDDPEDYCAVFDKYIYNGFRCGQCLDVEKENNLCDPHVTEPCDRKTSTS